MRVELSKPILLSTSPSLDSNRLESLMSGAARVAVAAGQFRIQRCELTDGPSAGVELLLVDSGNACTALCPTRGMSIWKARINDLDCGWDSSVQGPIHPKFVALNEASGLGWLDGFDELLVRCGLRNFGAPDFNANGQLEYPLHGRVGNLPARNVEVHVDTNHSLLEIHGEVHECRFMQTNLRLKTKTTLALGQSTIGVHDTVTNAAGTPSTMQLLYHINMGQPFLQAGCKAHVAADKVVARNEHAARGVSNWQEYAGPQAGFEEQVYFFEGLADKAGWSQALLTSPDAKRGFGVHFKTDTLPYFTQWKNTVAESDGYVTGLEPGTGFPNPRSFEQQQGRLVELQPGESREFQLRLEAMQSAERVAEVVNEIGEISGQAMATSEFQSGWCLPRD